LANVLTNLIPVIYESLDTVSKERAGFTKAVRTDFDATGVGKDQTIRIPVTPVAALEAISAKQLPTDSGSQTIGYQDLVLDKAYAAPILWNGEEELSQQGKQSSILADQMKQGFRSILNAMDADIAAQCVKASRAAGSQSAVPFATANDFSDFAYAMEVMEKNGAPAGDLHMVLGAGAIRNLRGKQSSLWKVNEYGSDELIRTGSIGLVEGFNIHQSASIKASTTFGVGAAFAVNKVGGYAVGATSIVYDGGAGGDVINAGDVITFAGDLNKYVVKTGDAAGAAGTLVLQEPGLLQTLANDVVITNLCVAAVYNNMFFDRNAIVLAVRPPAVPSMGDMAMDRTLVTDPETGMTFSVAVYPGYMQNKIELQAVWGSQIVAPRHCGLLLSNG